MNPIKGAKPESNFDKFLDSAGSAGDSAVRGLSRAASWVGDLYTDTFERHPLATTVAAVGAAGAYLAETCRQDPEVCVAIVAGAPLGM